jgi:hypothetical protein
MEAEDRPDQGFSQPRSARKCPFCRRGGIDPVLTSGYLAISCTSCGQYEIEQALADKLRELPSSDPDYRLCRYLGCHTRQQTEGGETAQISQAEWRQLAIAHQTVPTRRKLDRLLAVLAERCRALSGYAEYDPAADGFLIDEPGSKSFMELLNKLDADNCLEFDPPDCEFPTRISVTVAGWLRYDSIASEQGTPPTGVRSTAIQPSNQLMASHSNDPEIQTAGTLTEDEIKDLLKNNDRLTYETAAKILHVGIPQIRKLVRQKKLERVGEGHHKKITTDSLRRRRGIPKPSREEIRNPSEPSGTKRN